MGNFTGLREAARGYSSNPLSAGKYVLRIDGCDSFEAKMKGWMWKTTVTILAIVSGGDGHKVGEQAHIFYKKGQYPDLYLSNIKGFMASVLDVDDSDVGEKEAEAVLVDGGPMDGLVSVATGRLQASRSKKNDDGTPAKYTVFSWQPSLDDDEIADAIGEEAIERFFPNGLGDEDDE